MRFIVAIFTIVLLTVCVQAAPPVRTHPPIIVHTSPAQHHNNSYAPRYAYGNHVHTHPLYNYNWRGWSSYRWYAPLFTYIYWCPVQLTWYYYDGVVFVPVYDY